MKFPGSKWRLTASKNIGTIKPLAAIQTADFIAGIYGLEKCDVV
jgi:hypothetical protein